ncbi:MAG: AAA family ATPase [Eubacteriales bacterium]|nr:AAA family ATPase [Eubacteriales bacterium]
MKITSVSIDNFGKFRNFHINTDDGVNVIFGGNEQGKTTLMTFIRMMFYGAGSGGNDIIKYPRKKYAPWDGAVMAGVIEFTHKDKQYRLEKVFANSVKTDKTRLINKVTGETIKVSDSREIGRMFFGMGEDAFERSLFIGQAGTLIDSGASGSSEIINRLQNLVSSGNEKESYTDIYARLSKAYEVFRSKSGRVGIVDRRKTRISELEDIRSEALQTETEKNILLEKYYDAERELKFLKERSKELDKRKKDLQKAVDAFEIRNILRLRDEEERLTAEKNKLEQNLCKDSVVADQRFLEETAQELNDLMRKEVILSERRDELELLKGKLEELNRRRTVMIDEESIGKIIDLQKETERLQDRFSAARMEISDTRLIIEQERSRYEAVVRAASKIRKLKVYVIIAIAVALAFTIAGGLSNPYFFIGTAVCVMSIIFLAFDVTKTRKNLPSYDGTIDTADASIQRVKEVEAKLNDLAEESDTINDQRTDIERELSVFLADNGLKEPDEAYKAYASLKSLRDSIFALVSEVEDKEKRSAEDNKLFEEQMARFFDRKKAFFDIRDIHAAFLKLEELRNDHVMVSSVRSQLTDKSKEIRLALNGRTFSELENELALTEGLTGIEHSDRDTLLAALSDTDTEIYGLRERQTGLESSLVKYRTEMEKSFSGRPELSEIDDESDRLKAEISALTVRANALDLARNVLKDAFEEMQLSFGPIVNEKTAKIFTELTCGKYSELSVSKELSISVKDPGGNKTIDWKYLSSGTTDQLYFALRLAIAEFFAEENDGITLFLDDPFMQYDDERAKSAAEFILGYSKERNYQILLFTCHRSTLGYFDRFDGCKVKVLDR